MCWIFIWIMFELVSRHADYTHAYFSREKPKVWNFHTLYSWENRMLASVININQTSISWTRFSCTAELCDLKLGIESDHTVTKNKTASVHFLRGKSTFPSVFITNAWKRRQIFSFLHPGINPVFIWLSPQLQAHCWLHWHSVWKLSPGRAEDQTVTV